MSMRIGKTREGNARDLDSPRSFGRKSLHLGFGSNGNDPAGRYGNRLGFGILRIQREKLPDEDLIKRRGLRLVRTIDRRRRQRKQRNKNHAGYANTFQSFLKFWKLFHASHSRRKRRTTLHPSCFSLRRHRPVIASKSP